MRTQATTMLIDHIYLQSPQASRRRESWSMTGRPSTNRWNGHFARPSHLCWRSPHRSIIDPPAFLKYRLSHCFPNIATNAASSEVRRLAYMRPVTVTISSGGPPWASGTMGVPPGIADWLRVSRIARRRAADSSFGSGLSPDWTSTTKAVLTAESKPAFEIDELNHKNSDGGRTKIKVMLRSSSYFLM